MNAHSIRHAWFPPSIPKRKHERELDAESEWPSAYRPLSGPSPGEPRPAKRLRALEGGLAGLTLDPIHTDTAFLSAPQPVDPVPVPTPVVETNQIHDAPLGGEAEPYISSIYEWASPHTAGVGSSVASLPLRGEVSEVNTSDEDEAPMMEEDGKRMGEGVFVSGNGLGYTVYEPASGLEKRKWDGEDEGGEKKGKRTWYEPEKDRIVVLDLDSSEDESANRSPRRRRSAFSLSSTSQSSSSNRPRSQTDAPAPEYIINPTLLSHLPPTPVISIPREEDLARAVVLFKPVVWNAGVREEESSVDQEAPVEAKDDDAMDIDS